MKLKDVVKNISKAVDAMPLETSPYSKVTEWLSTGNYALNRVISGSCFKGIPQGRITTLFGESSSGKSLIAYQTAINAIKDNKIDVVFIFDSEGGVLTENFERSGIPMDKINYIPVTSIEDCSVKMMQVYDALEKSRKEYLADPENNDNIRALCILDSYGALVSEKQLTDAIEKDKMVNDMGVSAKMRNALIRGMMMKVVTSNVALICINHTYADPSAMFASKIKNMSGGEGIRYASHVIVQCEKLLVKSSDTDFLTGIETGDGTGVGFYKGNKLKFFTVKNRVCKPCFTAECFIDFTYGLAKYDGLIADAVKMKFLEEVRGGYICPTYEEGKKITYKTLVSTPAIWDSFLMKFDEKSKEIMEYSNFTSKAIDDLQKTIDDEEIE